MCAQHWHYFNFWVKCWGLHEISWEEHFHVLSDTHYDSNCLFWSQIKKKNVLKDFVTIAGPLGVTHFIIFSKTPTSVNMVSHWGSGDFMVLLCWRCNTVRPTTRFLCFSETCSTSQRSHASLQSAEGKYIWSRKENTRTLNKWAQMMTDWHLTVSDVFKVNALMCPNWKSHL